MIDNPEYRAYLSAMADVEHDRQRAIILARRYYAGDQPVYLTDRMKEFIGIDTPDGEKSFRMNIFKTVVKAAAERLNVTGFDSDEAVTAQGDGTATKPLAAWAGNLWQVERMDGRAMQVHRGAIRDGEYYVIVAPDEDEQRACFYPHPAYCAPLESIGGDGYGVKVFYVNDDVDGDLAYAVKHWTQKEIVQDGDRIRHVNTPRMTIYWPDRIERYVQQKGAWQQYIADGQSFPIPWVQRDGRPIGVPVVAFCMQDGRGRADDALGLQDALNKGLVDLVAAADLSAFQILVALGWIPTTDGLAPAEDGSNMQKIGPGALLGTTRSASEADLKAIPGADLGQLITSVDKLVQWVAMVTDTPLSRFLVTGQIAAEGTLKQQEGPLVADVEALQVTFGDAWEDCLALARIIENTYFNAGLPEDVTLQTQWAPAATRDEVATMATAEAKHRLGVPARKLWAELGYSESEIVAMQAMKAEQDAMAMERQQALQLPRSNGRDMAMKG